MVWPFSKKPKKGLEKLVFKSGREFFDYHCAYMQTKLEVGVPLVGLVLDAREELGMDTAVQVRDDGVQNALLRIASDDGGFLTLALTTSEKGDRLQAGDVVAWIPSEMRVDGLVEIFGDQRSAQLGLIVAKVAPEIDMEAEQMTVICNY